MFEIIFLIFICIYFVQTIIFIVGAAKKYPKLNKDKLPAISVIVAARNEEDNILDCIRSLDKLKYPEEKIEIILVDDNSDDRTGEIIEDFIKEREKFKFINSTNQIKHLKGKANAIANALEVAAGEVILTTDADCEVSPTWAITLASYFQEDVAMVCGYTNQEEDTIFKAMQSVDFIYLLAIAGGSMNLGKPLSCIGNNMSYRKSVYDAIGGYESISFSVTEDLKLLMTIHQLKKYKIIYPADAGGLVRSKACHDIKSLYWQKKRWGVGGLDSDPAGFGVVLVGIITHICLLLTPFLFSMNALYLTFFKFFIDFSFLRLIYNRLNLKLLIKDFLVFELYFIGYVLLLPVILMLSRKVKWKGREFS